MTNFYLILGFCVKITNVTVIFKKISIDLVLFVKQTKILKKQMFELKLHTKNFTNIEIQI